MNFLKKNIFGLEKLIESFAINKKFECIDDPKLETFNLKEKMDLNSDIDCLVLPYRVWDGKKKENFTVSVANPGCKTLNCNMTGCHGYEIFITNSKDNILNINIIDPNFFCIINTKYINSDVLELKKENSKLQFINIDSLDDNDSTIKKRDIINGNICHDPDNKSGNGKYKPSSKEIPVIKKNMRIFIMGDYLPCNPTKLDKVNNVYIYVDNGKVINAIQKCTGKLKMSLRSLGNNKNINISEDHNGYQHLISQNIKKNSVSNISTLKINFDPRNSIGRNGFTAIYIIRQSEDKIIKNLSFNETILKNLKAKLICLKVKFWLTALNLTSNGEIIDKSKIQGPYSDINFFGNPKIIIYIPSYIFPNNDKILDKEMTNDELKIKNIESKNINYQTDTNICNIYVNFIY